MVTCSNSLLRSHAENKFATGLYPNDENVSRGKEKKTMTARAPANARNESLVGPKKCGRASAGME